MPVKPRDRYDSLYFHTFPFYCSVLVLVAKPVTAVTDYHLIYTLPQSTSVHLGKSQPYLSLTHQTACDDGTHHVPSCPLQEVFPWLLAACPPAVRTYSYEKNVKQILMQVLLILAHTEVEGCRSPEYPDMSQSIQPPPPEALLQQIISLSRSFTLCTNPIPVSPVALANRDFTAQEKVWSLWGVMRSDYHRRL